MLRILFIAVLFLAIVSCNKEDNEELPANFEGYSYLPLKVGAESIFRIDSIAYDDFTGTKDTTVYYLRELVESAETDLGGRTVFKVAVFQRNHDTLPWQQIRIDEKHRGVYRYELSRNSIPYVPLVFPPLQESRWNVNLLNNQAEQTYKYQKLHQLFSYQGKSYDSTLTVLQRDFLSLIGREYAREVYASNIGLVFQETINVETDINSGEIQSGFERRIVRID